MQWNQRAPLPAEYAALTEAKRLADQPKNHRTVVYAKIKGTTSSAGVYRCDLFGYVCWIAKPSEFSATGDGPDAYWIGFPDRDGNVSKEGSVFRRRVLHHHQLPDLHVYR
jgi:hypothetical protein